MPDNEKTRDKSSRSEPANVHRIDVRGFQCPLPVLKAAKRMAPLPPGTRVEILATDPMSAIDVPHFCNEKGHILLNQEQKSGVWHFVLEKGPAAKS